MNLHSLLSLLMLGMTTAVAAAGPATPPVAPVRPVTDTYFGTAVVDNYRWMEAPDSTELITWMKGQGAYTRTILDSLPGRDALLQRVHQLGNADLSRGGFVRRGQRYFYQTFEPGSELPRLYYRDGLQGQEHLLIDPAQLGKGSPVHYALDFYTPSWDGRYLAYGVSAGGSEESVLHVLEVDSGRMLAESIDRTSDSVIAWRPDNRSFFYLRFVKPTPGMPPADTKFNARTYLHVLGMRLNGDDDPVVFGRGVSTKVDVPAAQGTYIVLAPDSPYAIAVANRNMDNAPAALFVAPLAAINGSHTPWRKLADFDAGVTQFEAHGDSFYFLSQQGAPRFQLLRTSLAHPDVMHAAVVVPQSPVVLTDFAVARDGLYLRERDGAVSKLARVGWDGKDRHVVPLPFEGNIFAPVTDAREAGALFSLQGWVQPPKRMFYDPATDASIDTGLSPPSKVDVSQLEAREVFAESYDGTRIPLSIVARKGLKLDASHPVIMQGYGSYGISLEPYFDARSVAWIEHGGILAYAHIRGGGEYGEDWHRAGQKLTKLNTVMDFIACGQYLVDQHYTAPKYLAGEGGSAGGITVGGALTWRPDLFGVILDDVGMSDALRAETTPNGPPNVPEFGSVTTEDGFHGLFAMSPYAHVRDGTAYPAVLFTTGVNDPRVASWEVAKMVARVQAASSSGRPVLLRVDFDAGHGIGSTVSQREGELADQWSFALWQMGDAAFQPAAAKP